MPDSARTVAPRSRFFDPEATYVHYSDATFDRFQRHGRKGHDQGGIFFAKDTEAQRAYASKYGRHAYRASIHLSPDEVFELSVPEHVSRVAEVTGEQTPEGDTGEDFLRVANSAPRFGHLDWTSVNDDVLRAAGFRACVLAERPEGVDGYTEDILSLCVFDQKAIEIVGRSIGEALPRSGTYMDYGHDGGAELWFVKDGRVVYEPSDSEDRGEVRHMDYEVDYTKPHGRVDHVAQVVTFHVVGPRGEPFLPAAVAYWKKRLYRDWPGYRVLEFGYRGAQVEEAGTRFNIGPVWHGTEKSFDRFARAPGARGLAPLANYEVTSSAFFFATSETYARGRGKNVLTCYLAAHHPLDLRHGWDRYLDSAKVVWGKADEEGRRARSYSDDGGPIDALYASARSDEDREWLWGYLRHSWSVWHIFDKFDLAPHLKAAGFDSIVFDETDEDSGDTTTWAVFDPEQIRIVPQEKTESENGSFPIRVDGVGPRAVEAQAALAALQRTGHLYRGMTQAEWEATLGAGRGVQSRRDWSASSEGTKFADEVGSAESYANFGSTDPRKTGKPNYLVEVRQSERFKRDRQGYYDAFEEVPRSEITRAWIMYASGNEVLAREIGSKPKTERASDDKIQAISTEAYGDILKHLESEFDRFRKMDPEAPWRELVANTSPLSDMGSFYFPIANGTAAHRAGIVLFILSAVGDRTLASTGKLTGRPGRFVLLRVAAKDSEEVFEKALDSVMQHRDELIHEIAHVLDPETARPGRRGTGELRREKGDAAYYNSSTEINSYVSQALASPYHFVKSATGSRSNLEELGYYAEGSADSLVRELWLGLDTEFVKNLTTDNRKRVWKRLYSVIETLRSLAKQRISHLEAERAYWKTKNAVRYPVPASESESTFTPPRELVREAAKHDSYESFHDAFLGQLHHGMYWHVTESPNFSVDAEKGPRDLSSMSASSRSNQGALMVTSDLEGWAEHYKTTRAHAALLDLSAYSPREYTQVGRGMGNEMYIHDASRVRVLGTYLMRRALLLDRTYNQTLPRDEEMLRQTFDASRGLRPQVTPKSEGSADVFVESEFSRYLISDPTWNEFYRLARSFGLRVGNTTDIDVPYRHGVEGQGCSLATYRALDDRHRFFLWPAMFATHDDAKRVLQAKLDVDLSRAEGFTLVTHPKLGWRLAEYDPDYRDPDAWRCVDPIHAGVHWQLTELSIPERVAVVNENADELPEWKAVQPKEIGTDS